MNPRRRFIAIAPWYALGGASLLAACSPSPPAAPGPTPSPMPPPAPAPAPAPVDMAAAPAPGGMVSPTDPQAVTLGYVAVSSQADKAKYPTHLDTQMCSGCALYSGAAGAAAGPCSLFAGRQVSAQGWCSAWAKKA